MVLKGMAEVGKIYIHPAATVEEPCEIGEGTKV